MSLMNRNYEVDDIINIVKDIKETFPHIYLETHIIYGFPSETEAEFRDSFELLEYFDSVVYFYYSDRRNVKSSLFPDKVSFENIIDRTRYIMAHPNFTQKPDTTSLPLVLLGYDLSASEIIASIKKNVCSDTISL